MRLAKSKYIHENSVGGNLVLFISDTMGMQCSEVGGEIVVTGGLRSWTPCTSEWLWDIIADPCQIKVVSVSNG